MKLRIGTRKSKLAMVQTGLAAALIKEKFPEAEIELVPLSTVGDRILDQSLTAIGGKGVFTKELDEALLAGTIDLAVHSAKDMPMEFLDGLSLGAVLGREHPGDVLVTRSGVPAKQLPAGSVIGTSSLRRELQMKRLNPQISIKLLRGNVLTRLKKLEDGEYDGILLAAAGLRRLGLTDPAPQGLHLEYLDHEIFVPAPGQGILSVEVRTGELTEVMEAIHSAEAEVMLRGERKFLMLLGGGCNAPCGAYCRMEGERLVMSVMYASDGVSTIYRKDSRRPEPGEAVNYKMAEALAEGLAVKVCAKMVSLVGAGPGDAGLLTVKGQDCVRRADVIVYDNLISGAILNEARLDAELIYVGKRSECHTLPQEEINRLLVRHAGLGRYVVRLKGGDPFVFGRGGEEARELRRQGIPFEIVPGISSACSVPAYAGIPVTERSLASSFHVITGYEGKDKSGKSVDYAALAQVEGTLVFLMGRRNLREIAAQLICHGKPEDTPAAVIQQGTTARQKAAFGTLVQIAEAADRQDIKAPAVIVIGDVVTLEPALSWFGRAPLSGKRVLATGTRAMVKELEAELNPLGAETVPISLIECQPLITDELKRALHLLTGYQWLVFTSGNGVDQFFDVMRQLSLDLRSVMHIKFAVVGSKTGAALRKYGFSPDFVPSDFSGQGLADEWVPQLAGSERILLLRAREGIKALPQALKRAEISYTDIPFYETWVDYRRQGDLNRAVPEIDYITVASGSAARALAAMLDPKLAGKAKIISIGPTTTAAACAAGLPVYKSTDEYTAAGIAAAIYTDVVHQTDSPGPDSDAVEAPAGNDLPAVSDAAYFPMFVPLKDRRVLIVGAGRIAARRAKTLVEFGARVVAVAPAANDEMQQLIGVGQVHYIQREFVPEDIGGATAVIAAANQPAVNDRVAETCREQRIPVNHSGDQTQCDFYFPGIAKAGMVVAGITASGSDHRLAGELSQKLREWLSQTVGGSKAKV